MTTQRRSAAAADRSWWLAGVVFAPFVLLSMLLLDSIRNESARRQTERQVLGDYGLIAVTQLRQKADSEFHAQLDRAFHGIMHPAATGAGVVHRPELPSAPPGELLERVRRDDLALLRRPLSAFRLDLVTSAWTTAGNGYAADEQRAIVARLRAIAAESEREPHRLILDTLAGRRRSFALFLVRQMDGPPRIVYGVEGDPAELARAFESVVRRHAILPSALLSPPYDSDVLRASIHAPGDSPMAPPDDAAVRPGLDSLPAYLSGASIRVYAGPGLAAALRIGRPSRWYVPALGGLQVLSLLLAVAALVQVRRIRDVARLRERFVADVSHELRTPLTQMSMFAEMLADDRDRPEAKRREYAGILQRETRRLSALVERVLDFARNRQGAQPLAIERRSLRSDVEDAVSFFAPIAAGAERAVNVEGPDGIHVHANPDAVRQILLNLLDNALKHGAGPIAVRLASSSREAAVTVSDRGRGIPVPDQERAFEPFVRIENPGRPATSGAGIGLSVVRDLSRALGGRVWIEPSTGAGFAVTFTLPVAEATS